MNVGTMIGFRVRGLGFLGLGFRGLYIGIIIRTHFATLPYAPVVGQRKWEFLKTEIS